MAALAELVKTPYWDKKDPPELQFRHDMMRAKLYGFTRAAGRRSCGAIRRPIPACRRATRAPSRPTASATCTLAIAQIEGLIQAMPNNPYFYELEGQALLEGGNPAEAIRAAAPRGRARPQPRAHPDLAGAGADRHQQCRKWPTRPYRFCAPLWSRNRNPRRLSTACDGLWPQEAILPMPISPPRRRLSRAATTRPRANSPHAPRHVFAVGSPGWVKADDIVAFNKGRQNPLRIGQ